MPDYRRPLEFGANVDPTASELRLARDVAAVAEARGLDLLGVQDHPYQWRFLDTWMLLPTLLAETETVRVFPNVANLPLRGPAMMAKAAASLDVISGGRFELGLGAGSFWEAIAAMGGPVRRPARRSTPSRRRSGHPAVLERGADDHVRGPLLLRARPPSGAAPRASDRDLARCY